MTTYAITSVTGRFGQAALKHLNQIIKPDDQIIGLARNISKAKTMVPKNIIVKKGDFNEHITLQESLVGVDKLLFISSQPGQAVSRSTQHLNVVRAAQKAGVKFIAYTSFPHADTATTELAIDHQKTEKALLDSGIKTSFLRNNWYLENEIMPLQTALDRQTFFDATNNQFAGWALEQEYAQAASKVLTLEDPKPIYEFSGLPRTYAELINNMHTEVTIKTTSLKQLGPELSATKYPENKINAIVFNQTIIADGQLAQTSTDLTELLGHPLMNIKDALEKLLK